MGSWREGCEEGAAPDRCSGRGVGLGGDAELQQVHGVCGRCVPRSHSWMEAFTQQLCPSCLDLLEHKEGDVHSLLLAAAWAGAAETKRS